MKFIHSFIFLGLNDGASAVVLASASYVNSKGLKPLAKILGFAEIGLEPMCMGLGPIKAVTKLVCILIRYYYIVFDTVADIIA